MLASLREIGDTTFTEASFLLFNRSFLQIRDSSSFSLLTEIMIDFGVVYRN